MFLLKYEVSLEQNLDRAFASFLQLLFHEDTSAAGAADSELSTYPEIIVSATFFCFCLCWAYSLAMSAINLSISSAMDSSKALTLVKSDFAPLYCLRCL